MTSMTSFRSNGLRSAALVSAAALGLGMSAMALANTDSSEADATIVAALTLTNIDGLNFGSVVADATDPGTVIMTSGGDRTCNTVICAEQDPGLVSSFEVTGEPDFSYDVTLPGSITLSDGTNEMTVDAFTDSEDGVGTLDGTGNGSFNVGATLNVAAGQEAGAYTGTFDVTVDYN